MERGTKAFVQVGCNGGAGIGIALRGGVAEEIVIVFGIEQLLDGLMNGGRSRFLIRSRQRVFYCIRKFRGLPIFLCRELPFFLKSCVNPPEVNCLPLF